MKLQLALDTCSQKDLMVFIKELVNDISIIETGTTLILSEGAEKIKLNKNTFENKLIFADFKIMYARILEADIVFESGVVWYLFLDWHKIRL